MSEIELNNIDLPNLEGVTNESELRTLAAFVFNLIEAQITRADTKAGLVIAADSVLITVSIFFTRRGGLLTLFDASASPLERVLSVLYVLIFGALFFSMFYGLLAARPALVKKGTGGTLFFFGRIAQHEPREFIDIFSKQPMADHHASLLTEVYNTARIASQKFVRVRKSIDFLILALFLWAIIVALNAFAPS